MLRHHGPVSILAMSVSFAAPLYSCNTDLATCKLNLDGCSSTTKNCKDDLATCYKNERTCSSNWRTCNSDLGSCYKNERTCNSDWTNCMLDLGTCNSSLTTCTSSVSDLTMEIDDLTKRQATCNTDLMTCNTNVLSLTKQNHDVTVQLNQALANLQSMTLARDCYSCAVAAIYDKGTCTPSNTQQCRQIFDDVFYRCLGLKSCPKTYITEYLADRQIVFTKLD